MAQCGGQVAHRIANFKLSNNFYTLSRMEGEE